jgi:hypothetical protein
MKKLIGVAFGLLVALSASTVFAVSATDTNKTIVRIGTQVTQAYIELSPALTIAGGCLFGLVYVANTSTAEGKAYYATLLTAYSQGKPLSRVDYANSASGGQCFVTLLEIN